jgi:methylmalonyl-CoA mutase cobalamin-binding subunit
MTSPALHKPRNPVRFVTASSLFDGHDASINTVPGILQAQGAEVVHLGHNRSVDEASLRRCRRTSRALPSARTKGGHVEYFGYLAELLAAQGAAHVKVASNSIGSRPTIHRDRATASRPDRLPTYVLVNNVTTRGQCRSDDEDAALVRERFSAWVDGNTMLGRVSWIAGRVGRCHARAV